MNARKELLDLLRAFARYQTHAGYVWAAIMDDGDLMCERCVRANYRAVFRATRDWLRDGWTFAGLMCEDEAETTDECCHCHKLLWERTDEESATG